VQVSSSGGIGFSQEIVEQRKELLHNGILTEIVVTSFDKLLPCGTLTIDQNHTLGFVNTAREGNTAVNMGYVREGVVPQSGVHGQRHRKDRDGVESPARRQQ